MCLIITVLLAAFAFNFFAAGHFAMGAFALLGSIAFATFMIRNILRTKKERNRIDIKECLSCPTQRVDSTQE